jgi:hypothetical protein
LRYNWKEKRGILHQQQPKQPNLVVADLIANCTDNGRLALMQLGVDD